MGGNSRLYGAPTEMSIGGRFQKNVTTMANDMDITRM